MKRNIVKKRTPEMVTTILGARLFAFVALLMFAGWLVHCGLSVQAVAIILSASVAAGMKVGASITDRSTFLD